MDCKELIERTKCPDSVRGCKYLGQYDFSCKKCREQTMKDCVTAIETLLAEREKSVEVVRCKDCENYILTGRPPFMYHACTRLGAIRTVDEDDFCKYGTPPDRQQAES